MGNGFCVWFTGLSASGKTTLANMLKDALVERGLRVEVLDGDTIRRNLSKGLGFSREDRDTNLKRIAFVANLLARNGVAVIVATISPYQSIRDEIRESIDGYVEVYLNCPVEVCIERDPKGLYKKALSGEIANFTGISDPYEPPFNPDIIVPTHEGDPRDSLVRLLRSLEIRGCAPPAPEEGYTEEEAEALKKKLDHLGYM